MSASCHCFNILQGTSGISLTTETLYSNRITPADETKFIQLFFSTQSISRSTRRLKVNKNKTIKLRNSLIKRLPVYFWTKTQKQLNQLVKRKLMIGLLIDLT